MGTTLAAAVITRTQSAGLDVVTLSRPSLVEYYITAYPVRGKSQFSMFESVARFIKETGATIVIQDVFGPCKFHKAALMAMETYSGEVNWPVSWMEGDGYVADSITSTQVYAISGAKVEPVFMDDRPIGGVFEDLEAKYCLLGDIRSANLSAPRFDQAYETFEKMEKVLNGVGMDFSNVLRTWLYTSRILEWYGDLNKARDKFFTERNVFNNLVPASTGIGQLNPSGSAVVADLFAVQPKSKNVKTEKIASPLQCPALDYKSSFSRAVELRLSSHTILFISGTASIEMGGATAYVGNLEKQIALTMEVVYAILKSRGMDWGDVSRAAAYFKDIKEAPLFHKYCNENNLPLLPVAVAHADICRDDLLFEVEMDAIKRS
ncbi:MAG: translation initiation inhibitor [Kiritimatiellae bacterium]|nr:translation initiation inhibitor [Kiritimatiellia bacterium]MDD5522001.1 translation initiation inhibitor [Kiritimatiellia bacterium]